MAEEQKKSDATPAAPGGKKPYTKPGVTSESIYEVTALACGKTPGAGGNCMGNRGGPHSS